MLVKPPKLEPGDHGRGHPAQPEIKRAVIVYQGELTPDYRYLEKYVRGLG